MIALNMILIILAGLPAEVALAIAVAAVTMYVRACRQPGEG